MEQPDDSDRLNRLLDIYRTQSALAAALGTTQATVSRWLSSKRRVEGIRYEFRQRLEELAVENGLVRSNNVDPGKKKDRNCVPEIDLKVGMGGDRSPVIVSADTNSLIYSGENVRDYWRLPSWFFLSLGIEPANVAAVPVQGDSMSPTLTNGDVIFIDATHRIPSPPGIYALLDELGSVIVKRLELIPRTEDSQVVRVSSDNPRHESYERGAGGIVILGRYIGRFTS